MIRLPESAVMAAARAISNAPFPSQKSHGRAELALRMALPHLYAIEAFASRLPQPRLVTPTTADDADAVATAMHRHASELEKEASEFKRSAARMARHAKMMRKEHLNLLAASRQEIAP